MSDLREQIVKTLQGAGWPMSAERAVSNVWHIIEAELQQLRNIADDKEKQRWEDANDYAILKQRVYKLLEQTIEVLEGFPTGWALGCADWWCAEAKPLLDKLQALKKEGTE